MQLDNTRSPRDVTDGLTGQALASRRLGFSVTAACPLRCAHCSVDAAPDLGRTTFPPVFTDKVVGEMSEIAGVGITCIDFTGGEPTLAAEFVGRVSEKAREFGITSGIVTAAHWAADATRMRTFLARFPDIAHWDISTDIYHLPFVPVESVQRAFELLSETGRPPMIRVAHHDPIGYDEAVLIDAVHKFAGRRMSFQPIGPVGRGEGLVKAHAATLQDYDSSACPTTGPLVQPGGRVAPCCAPLSHERLDHPLILGNAFEEPLAKLIHAWRVNPLLQTIRLWGFQPIVEWLGGIETIDRFLRGRQCDTCVAIARHAGLMFRAAHIAERLENRVRVAHALSTWFHEPWMEELLLSEASLHASMMGDQAGA